MQTRDQNPVPASRLAALIGTSLTPDQFRERVRGGARCVRFEYCLSAFVATVRRQSAVYLTTSPGQRFVLGLGYSLLALLLGPWGVPWGLVWTPRAVWINLSGGADTTESVLAWLDEYQSLSRAE